MPVRRYSDEEVRRIIALTAEAEANQRIATLMRNLDASSLFMEPTLKSIQEDPDNAHYGAEASAFNLTFAQTPPHPVSDSEQPSDPSGPEDGKTARTPPVYALLRSRAPCRGLLALVSDEPERRRPSA